MSRSKLTWRLLPVCSIARKKLKRPVTMEYKSSYEFAPQLMSMRRMPRVWLVLRGRVEFTDLWRSANCKSVINNTERVSRRQLQGKVGAARTATGPRHDATIAVPMSDFAARSVVIVGGGIVGLATALRMVERFPAARVILLEKEAGVGWHQTGHNSGVLHCGLYYKPGSAKARLAVTGIRQMVAFCRENQI